MIVGLGYKARTGKDTLADILVEEHGFERFAFADPLKAVLADMNPIIDVVGRRVSTILGSMKDWEEAKQSPEVRMLLQRLGVAAREHIHQGVWVGTTMRAVDAHVKAGGRAVITDMRFPNEVDAVAKRDGALVMLTRSGQAELKHISETALDSFHDWDYRYQNDGTLEDLADFAAELVKELVGSGEQDDDGGD